MSEAIPKGSAVYIRYRDHSLNQNIADANERETMGWLTQKVGDFICIQHDRTVEKFQYSSGSANGIVLRKNCILEIRVICEKGEQAKTGNTIRH